MKIKDYIRDISDFPSKGVVYRDISPLLRDSEMFNYAIESMYMKIRDWKIDVVVGIESRGYLFAAPLALKLKKGIVAARKQPGDHPLDVVGIDYAIQMGTNRIEMMRGSIGQGDNVLIVDDLLATGVTARATADLVKQQGGNVSGFAFLADINSYDGLSILESVAPVVHVYDC